MFSEEKKQQLIKRLTERFEAHGQKVKCPMCGHEHFTIADGYLSNTMQDSLNSFSLGGPSIPTVSIICTNCGFLSQHSLGILGLLEREEMKNGEK